MHKYSIALLITILTIFLMSSAATSGVDSIALSNVTPLISGSYTSATMGADHLYTVRSGSIDWITDPSGNGDWISVPLIAGSYVSVAGADDGTLYAAVSGGGLDHVYWSGQWMASRIISNKYVSVAVNTNTVQGGLFAAGAAGGIDRIYLDGAGWTRSVIVRGLYISLAPDTRNNGAIFAVKSDGRVEWIHYESSWVVTPLVTGNYVSVTSDTSNNGNCYAVRSNGTVDHIVSSNGQWAASTIAVGSYKAITADLINAGRLYAVAQDADTAISDAKKSVNHTHVQCNGIVTGYFDSYFYLSTPTRVSGIRVMLGSHKAVEGASAVITGITDTLPSGERYIEATSCNLALDHKLSPFYTNNQALGGGAFFNFLAGMGQIGVANGVGLNNIGMLVKTSGRISSISSDDTIFLTDGSRTPIRCVDPWGFAAYSIRESDYVAVAGVVSMDIDTYQSVPVLLLMDWKIIK